LGLATAPGYPTISNQEYVREKCMKINIVYKEEKGWFVGHIQEYPDYDSGTLFNNLIDIIPG